MKFQTHELGLFVYLCGLFGHNQMKEPKDNFWAIRDVILKDFNRMTHGAYFNRRTR